MESRYKVLMYVFLGLFIVAAGFGGYFGYKYNLEKKINNFNQNPSSVFQSPESSQIEEFSGNISSIDVNKIIIVDEKGVSKEFIISGDDTVVRKIQEDDSFIDVTLDNVVVDQLVYVQYIKQTDNNNYAQKIDILTK